MAALDLATTQATMPGPVSGLSPARWRYRAARRHGPASGSVWHRPATHGNCAITVHLVRPQPAQTGEVNRVHWIRNFKRIAQNSPACSADGSAGRRNTLRYCALRAYALRARALYLVRGFVQIEVIELPQRA